MDLLVTLTIVDELQGGKQMRQLTDGWMNRELRGGRWLRTQGARALLALAARLAPDGVPSAADRSETAVRMA